MSMFRRKPPKRYYGKGWACKAQHMQHCDNDGVCRTCGESVNPCVVLGSYISLSPYLYPDKFIRWL